MSRSPHAGTQLALDVRLRDGSSFDNFHDRPNREALAHIRAAVRRATARPHGAPFEQIFLWGGAGCGKTHLMEAAAREFHDAGLAPAYVSLRPGTTVAPCILEGLDSCPLVCLDDLHLAGGNRDWETALLHLYERKRVAGGLLLAAASSGPAQPAALLPDLATRLGAGLVFRLLPLGDDEKLAALRLRARSRGLEMGEEVARYVLSRYPRDTHALFRLLDRIDRKSLAAQRRLTIPFLRLLQDEDGL